MEITAVFDDVDTAEHALVQLRGMGLAPLAYKIKRIRPLPEQQGGGMADLNRPFGGVNALAAGGDSNPALPFNVWATNNVVWNNRTEEEHSDIASKEVLLSITVEDSAGIRAHRALVSTHGRRVRYR